MPEKSTDFKNANLFENPLSAGLFTIPEAQNRLKIQNEPAEYFDDFFGRLFFLRTAVFGGFGGIFGLFFIVFLYSSAAMLTKTCIKKWILKTDGEK